MPNNSKKRSFSHSRGGERIGWDAPLWKRERERKRQDRLHFHRQGRSCPTLKTAVLVELAAIYAPAWAQAKAIRGLESTASAVWLGRIAAAKLAQLDREAGGTPGLTSAFYRRCQVCERTLLGVEAEARLELDRKLGGEGMPCGPDCLEEARANKQAAKERKKGRGELKNAA